MAAGKFHNVFEPIRKNDVPVFPNRAAVAGVKPPVFQHGGRPLGVFVIAGKNTRLPIFYFTGGTDTYFRFLLRRSDRLKMDFIIPGAGEQSSFGSSIQSF